MKHPAVNEKKKLSPSTKRRNARRREQILARKSNSTQVQPNTKEASDIPATDDELDELVWVSCDLCGHETKTEGGMKLHKKNNNEILQGGGTQHVVTLTVRYSNFLTTQTWWKMDG